MATRIRRGRAPLTRAAAAPLAVALVLVACSGSSGVGRLPGAGDPYFPIGSRDYDATHYALTLSYAPATGRLTGTAEITARANRRLGSLSLDLDGMNVSSASVDGDPAAVTRSATKLTLRPRHAPAPGRSFHAVVHYAGVPRRITDPDGSQEGWLASDGGRRVAALGEPTGAMAWFPSDDRPGDKATYDISVSVPEGLTALSNGELRATRRHEGRTTYTWHTAHPMASYLATLVIGPYATHRTRLARAGGGGRALTAFTATDPQAGAGGKRLLDALPGIVAWEEKTFGPYPFSSTGVIIGRTGDSGYALETQNRPFLPGPEGTATLVHEMAHQWYGDCVTPASWRDMWLNEGFATYGTWLWLDSRAGKDRVPLARSFADAYASDANWAFPPADPPTAADISRPPVYGRGAMVLQRLREVVGDAAFFRILRGWPRAHRYGNATTADFTAYAEQQAGQAGKRLAAEVWRPWLYGQGKPEP
nr:M1 family metallopeptidase [Streptomyces sp. NRRL F-5126]